MIRPSERRWGRRMPPTAVPAEQPTDRDDERSGADHPRSAAAVADRCCCPVCEFTSDEFDDVYAHLMTAHRKSTISAALLRM